MSKELTIDPDPPRGNRGRQAKTRQFRAYLLGVVEADALWDRGTSKTRRPVWMAYAASRGMSRPFTANARGGRRIRPGSLDRPSECYDFPKSSPHRWTTQDAGDDALITTVYLPSLFHLDPVVPPERVTFISMPPLWWVKREAAKLREAMGEDAEDAARAGLLAAYLDRRVGLPIPSDLRFQLRLYRAFADSHLRIAPRKYDWSRDGIAADGMQDCGLDLPIAVDATHDEVAGFLTQEVRRYFEEVVRPERERQRAARPSSRRPYAAPVQLTFDFAMAAA